MPSGTVRLVMLPLASWSKAQPLLVPVTAWNCELLYLTVHLPSFLGIHLPTRAQLNRLGHYRCPRKSPIAARIARIPPTIERTAMDLTCLSVSFCGAP